MVSGVLVDVYCVCVCISGLLFAQTLKDGYGPQFISIEIHDDSIVIVTCMFIFLFHEQACRKRHCFFIFIFMLFSLFKSQNFKLSLAPEMLNKTKHSFLPLHLPSTSSR